MAGFNLKILTPNEVLKNQEVEKVIVRTTEGDVGILKNHVNYIAAIKEGPVTVFCVDGKKESFNIKDGFISVINSEVTIMSLSYDKIMLKETAER